MTISQPGGQPAATGKDKVRVFLGPEQPTELAEAITGAGGILVEAGDAEAIVWYGGKPDALPDLLSPAVR